MTTNTIIETANLLTTTFPKVEQSYSLGFTRLMKLNRKKSLDAFTSLYYEGFTEISANNAELKRRLAAMTEEEFKAFKKSK